ncbi:ABC transporter substrate-binding protein [Pelagibacterium sp.]|uniref:ABC transporter substrate-binding protein n=1 Tax=Pelagibacterium sp. TaxID=1967288 RepID=UPI002D7E41A2|nr:ABC transporter substrate-binding protein [Pelagibacterium sp.]
MRSPLLATLASVFLASIAGAQEINLTDMEGRAVTLEKPAERIATFPMPMASVVVSMDGGIDRLVGMNEQSYAAHFEGLLGTIFPEAADIPFDFVGNGFVPNVESLVTLSPDLVVQWGGRGNDIVDPITNAGLSTLLVLSGTEDNARGSQSLIAEAIGKPERFETMLHWRNEVVAAVEAKAAAIAKDDKPSVLYMLRSLSEITATGRENHYNTWYIEMAGGISSSAELNGTVPISAEQIAVWNPDVILLNSFEPELSVDWVYDHPILSQLAAAQEHRVYKMPIGGYRWEPASQESPLTWMWLANLLHPEVYDFDLRAEMRSAYEFLYNYEVSDAEIDSILRMDMQGDAANYAQFRAQ